MLIGFDPGVYTGFVVAIFDENAFQLIRAGQVFMDRIPKLLNSLQRPDTVIVEAFRIYPWRSKGLAWDNLPAAQVIGGIKAWCTERGVNLEEQPAAVRKTITNDMLKSFGLWRPTVCQPHARDAARHVLWYYKKKCPTSFVKFLEDRGVLNAYKGERRTSTRGAM